ALEGNPPRLVHERRGGSPRARRGVPSATRRGDVSRTPAIRRPLPLPLGPRRRLSRSRSLPRGIPRVQGTRRDGALQAGLGSPADPDRPLRAARYRRGLQPALTRVRPSRFPLHLHGLEELQERLGHGGKSPLAVVDEIETPLERDSVNLDRLERAARDLAL